MGKIESIPKKLGRTLIPLMFAVGFSGFGMASGALPLFGLVSQWYQARSYVPLPAFVQSTALKITTGETRNESVKASFAYRYENRDYVSYKVSSSSLSDNFDPYHRIVHARLLQAKESGQNVTIWVDPAHPANALYDRTFRWKPALFMLPFAVLFPAVGLGAWWGIWFVWWGKCDAGREYGPGELRAPSLADRCGPLAITLLAFFYNMLSWPMAMLSVLQTPPNGSLTNYLVLLFPFMGLGLVYWAAVTWRASWRLGKPMLELLQVPADRQYTLAGRIHFSPALGIRLDPALQMHPVRIVVKLQQTISNGDEVTTSTLWEKCVLDAALARGVIGINFHVKLPSSVPSPSTSQSPQREWLRELQALGSKISFELPCGLD